FDGRWVACQLVRDHNPRLVAVALDELAQEALGGMLITSRLDQDVQHDAVLVDRPPQPVATTTDTNGYFVEMPFVAGSSTTTTKLMGEGGPNLTHQRRMVS